MQCVYGLLLICGCRDSLRIDWLKRIATLARYTDSVEEQASVPDEEDWRENLGSRAASPIQHHSSVYWGLSPNSQLLEDVDLSERSDA